MLFPIYLKCWEVLQGEPYFSDPVFGTTKSISHSCNTQILNSLITGWKTQSVLALAPVLSKEIHLYTLIFILIFLMGHLAHKHGEGCLQSCTCMMLYPIFLSRSGISWSLLLIQALWDLIYKSLGINRNTDTKRWCIADSHYTFMYLWNTKRN